MLTDESGNITSIVARVSNDAHRLIEECMLAANTCAADFIGRHKRLSLYRVHDKPSSDRLLQLRQLLSGFGLTLQGGNAPTAADYEAVVEAVKGKPYNEAVQMALLRSMQRAVYSPDNIGHYGLGYDFYTHFTSPIRRYPDLMVHRLLERYMAGGRSVNVQALEDECEHASDMEQLAANAERASIKYKQVEYMSERLGQEYDGVISGITEWGLYVEINENKCEGLVPIRDLEDDYYEFDEKNYCLMGRRTHRIYRLGDPIRIKVARANLERKQLDFALAEQQ